MNAESEMPISKFYTFSHFNFAGLKFDLNLSPRCMTRISWFEIISSKILIGIIIKLRILYICKVI